MALETITLSTTTNNWTGGAGGVGILFNARAAHASGEAVTVVANVHIDYIGTMASLYTYIYQNGAQKLSHAQNAYNDQNISFSSTLSGALAAGQAELRIVVYPNAGTTGYGSMTVKNITVKLGSAAKVVAGNPIKKTDFDAVLQSATVGNKISNGNFTAGTTITASAWNTKWGL